MTIKQGATTPIPFVVVDVTNLQTRLDISTADAGGAMTFTARVIYSTGGSAGAGAVSQPDATKVGRCFYTPDAGDFATLGHAILLIEDSSGLMEPREIDVEVVAGDPFATSAATVF